MSGTSSVTTFIVGDRLPWPDESQPPKLGRFDPGAIYDGSARRECSIRKISAHGATLRGAFVKMAGDRVSVELVTGQRPAATVEWVRGGEAGVRFEEPVDLLALINRSLINQPSERRAMPRVEIRCAAHIKWGGRCEFVSLRNISARGLQIHGEHLPPPDTFVSVLLDGLVVPSGEVVWRKDDLAGIELLDELSWTSLVPWVREMMRKGVQ